jgi:hypothetical protein
MLAPDTIVQNRYRVVRQIGQGGMGTVYEATDLRLGNTVALKQMLLEQTDAQHIGLLRRAFEREARLLAGLRHPALPRVIDHFDDAAGQFLVMEFIPGDNLAAMQRKNDGPFPLDVVLRWADLALTAAPPPISIQSPYQPGRRIKIVHPTGIPLREAPQPNASKLVDQLKLDQQATINDVRGDWLKITLDDGTVGWARWYYDGTRYIDVIVTPVFVRTLLVQTPRLSGDDVRAAQQRLLDLGYREVGEIDGSYGPSSESATKRFQQANGLDADGVIGPATWEKLFSATAVRGGE